MRIPVCLNISEKYYIKFLKNVDKNLKYKILEYLYNGKWMMNLCLNELIYNYRDKKVDYSRVNK